MPYKQLRSNLYERPNKSQIGLVLFFALLALAVMSIASVALIRSVDTNSLLSGNMVFRQTASATSNVALEGITENITKKIALVNSTSHFPQYGYYANCSQFDTQPNAQICDGNRLTVMNWDNSNSSLVPSQTDGNDEIRDGIDRQGNEIRYVVERMCSYSNAEVNSGAAKLDVSRCLMASASGCNDGSYGGQNRSKMKDCPDKSSSPLYRLTLRIAGPKNTLTFMQSFISN